MDGERREQSLLACLSTRGWVFHYINTCLGLLFPLLRRPRLSSVRLSLGHFAVAILPLQFRTTVSEAWAWYSAVDMDKKTRSSANFLTDSQPLTIIVSCSLYDCLINCTIPSFIVTNSRRNLVPSNWTKATLSFLPFPDKFACSDWKALDRRR